MHYLATHVSYILSLLGEHVALTGGALAIAAVIALPAGAFAALVGRFAASLDRGVDAAEAFRASVVEGGWERSAG